MFEEFIKFLKEKNLLAPGDKVLLAVSGGIDSMVMANLFKSGDFPLAIAHCNFNLRGLESDEDQRFVESISTNWKVDCFVKQFDTLAYCNKNNVSIQVAARNLRYAWFDELSGETGYNVYATAHHFNDQMETFFINMLRGTGVSGLRGIPAKNGKCIRPLLFATRMMIEQYATANNIPFRDDSSNDENHYLRNRIRHFVLPALEKSEANYKRGIKQTMLIMEQSMDFIDAGLENIKKNLLFPVGETFEIPIEKIKQKKNALFILFELLKPFGFNPSHVQNIILALDVNHPGKLFYSSTHELVIDRRSLIISKIEAVKDETFYIDPKAAEIIKPVHLKMKVAPKTDDFSISTNENIAQLDFNKLKFPLKIRKCNEGDYFFPLGMKGRKKVSDFFVDQKIPVPEKRKIYLLLSGRDIVWIIGKRMDDRYKITGKTTKVLIVEAI
jgi:tRNA(Ile)-lysidine synthase